MFSAMKIVISIVWYTIKYNGEIHFHNLKRLKANNHKMYTFDASGQ